MKALYTLIILLIPFVGFGQEKLNIKRKDSEKKHTNLQDNNKMNRRRSEHLQYLNLNKNLYHINPNEAWQKLSFLIIVAKNFHIM